MKIRLLLIYTVAVAAVLPIARADVLELKNSKVLTGKYVGGSAGTIRFETAEGVQVIETGQALALTFTGNTATTGGSSTGAGASAPAPVAAAPAPAPAAAASAVSVPAGTMLTVRMLDGASSNDPKGKRFTTTLETDLIVGGKLVAKAGTRIYGRVADAQKAGRFVGKSTLDIRLTDLTVGGSLVPIATGPFAQASASSLRKTARGAAAGAAIGAIADDEAGKGAAIGAVASGLKKGDAVVVPAGTLLDFTLVQPVNITVSS